MPVTMRDVAERAGVSIATVSFVVNNTKPVKPKTRERIESAMAELGFQRNLVARALASRRTRILALVYPAQEHPMDRTSLEFVLSAARTAKDADHHLVIWPIANQSEELQEVAGQGLVDGVVLMEVQLDDPRVAVLQRAGLPFALIGRTRDLEGLASVDIDFDSTIALAVHHLVDLGHRRIVLVTGDQEDDTLPHYAPFVRQVQAFLRLARRTRTRSGRALLRSDRRRRPGRRVGTGRAGAGRHGLHPDRRAGRPRADGRAAPPRRTHPRRRLGRLHRRLGSHSRDQRPATHRGHLTRSRTRPAGRRSRPQPAPRRRRPRPLLRSGVLRINESTAPAPAEP